MIQYVVSGFIILAIASYLWLVYLPKRNLYWHAKVYRDLGYNVKVYDFKIFGIGFFDQQLKWQKQLGDNAYGFKTGEYSKYDIILSNFLTRTFVIFINPELIKNFLGPDSVYTYPKVLFLIANIKRLLGDGIAFSQGNVWKRKRKMITKVFTHEFIISNIPIICQVCDEVLQKIQQQHSKQSTSPEKIQIYILDIFTQMFSKTLLRSFFGRNMKNKTIEGQELDQYMMKLIVDANAQSLQLSGLLLGPWIFNLGLTANHRNINHRIKTFRKIAAKYIEDRVKEVKEERLKQKAADIIEAIVKEQNQKNQSQDNKYNFDELIDEFSTFLIGGTDTTAHLVMLMIYYTVLNPRVEIILRKEIQKYIKNEEDYNWEQLKKLEYVDWIQNQTMRVYGPGTAVFPREAATDNFMANIPIKKGDYVNFAALPNHYNPKIYKNPQEFRPERWQSQCNSIHPFAFLGFSSGPRTCIGKQFALLQSKIALIKFFKRYKKIVLPCEKLQFVHKFLYEPKIFKTTLQK